MGKNAQRHQPYVLRTLNSRLKLAEARVGKLLLAGGADAEVAAIQAMAADLRSDREAVLASPDSDEVVMGLVEKCRASQPAFRELVPREVQEGKGPSQTVTPEGVEANVSVGALGA